MPISISEAVAAIKSGQIIAYPTEAVYGVGCAPDNLTALRKLLALKSRDSNKGLILAASSWQQLSPYASNLSEKQLCAAFATWPGPVTWVVPAADNIDPLISGGRSTLAMRISAHPVVSALCQACDQAIISTSANISGQDPLVNESQIVNAFGDEIAGIVEGELGKLDKPTAIFDLVTGKQLR